MYVIPPEGRVAEQSTFPAVAPPSVRELLEDAEELPADALALPEFVEVVEATELLEGRAALELERDSDPDVDREVDATAVLLLPAPEPSVEEF